MNDSGGAGGSGANHIGDVVTDHRMLKDTIVAMVVADIEQAFADRSFVRDGCGCDYCRWEPRRA